MDRRRRGNLLGIMVFPHVAGYSNLALRKYFYGITEILKRQAMPYKPTGRRVGRPEKEDAFKPVSVKLPPDLLEKVRKYALTHQQSLSELIRDGLEWRISEGGIGYFRNTENYPVLQVDNRNTVILQEVKRLVQRLSGVVGASEVPVIQESSELEYSNTEIPKMAKPVHPVDEGAPFAEDLGVAAATKAESAPDISNYNNTVIQESAQPVPELDAQLPEYDNTVIQQQPSAKRSGRLATMREPILHLLSEHPEGLSAEQIRGLLNAQKPIGDTLQGMRRSNLVRTEGQGREMRYFLAW
jgi:hypothetical protein